MSEIYTIAIGDLVEAVAEFKQTDIVDHQEIACGDLGILAPTPRGDWVPVNYVIRKDRLEILRVELSDGHSFRCARGHLLRCEDHDVRAEHLVVGQTISTLRGPIGVHRIAAVGSEDCFDISIPSPHIYVDAQGIHHHNTILTATLSHLCEPHGRTVVIVPNKSLVVQTEDDYKNLGLDVGVFFGDRKEYGHKHTICTWQSLDKLSKGKSAKSKTSPMDFAGFIDDVVCVMVDEAHGARAEGMRNLLCGGFAHVPLRWGLTGTIPKAEWEFAPIRCSIGEVKSHLGARELMDRDVLAQCNINVLQLLDSVEFPDYQQEYNFLVTDPDRLDWLSQFIRERSLEGNTLVLFTRVETGKTLQANLPGSELIYGAVDNKKRKATYDDAADTDNMILLASYGVASTGINIPRIFNLILLEPGKSFVRVIQSIGRGIRKAKDKDHVEIWDVTSKCKFSSRHLTKRKQFYKEAEYPFNVEKVDYLVQLKQGKVEVSQKVKFQKK